MKRSLAIKSANPAPSEQTEPRPSWILNSFNDDQWYYHSSEGATRCANFKTVPDQYRMLCKLFLWSMESTDDKRLGRSRVLSPRAFNIYFIEARFFFRTCDRFKVGRISNIDPQMLDRIAALRFDRKISKRAPISLQSVGRLRSLYNRLYLFGPRKLGSLPDGLSFLPDPDLPEGLDTRGNGSTALMPDAVAQNVLNTAIEFLKYGPSIIACLRFEKDVVAALSASIERKRDRRQFREQFINKHGLGKSLESHVRLLQEIEPLTRSDQVLSPYRYSDEKNLYFDIIAPRRLESLRRHLVSAAFCVFAGFTGFRLSEIVTMEEGDVFHRGGRLTVRTRVKKTSGRPEGALVERTGPSIVGDAFSIVEKLAHLDDRSGRRVWLSASSAYLTSSTIGPNIRSFVNRVANEDTWHVTPHQFRRYFAVFYIRRYKGSTDALSYHFRHISQKMIETYIRDRAGAAYLLSAKRELAFEIGEDLIQGRGNYAAKDNLPLKIVEKRYRATNLPLDKIEMQAVRLLLAGFAEVHATEFGYCMVQKNDSEGAICGARDGIPDATEVHPGNCGSCRYLVVGREQLNHWERTLELHEKVLASPLALPNLKKASNAMIIKAKGIIDRFSLASSTSLA